MADVAHDADWFDELDLDPSAHPVSMGTRSLGDRPWLVADGALDHELLRKANLLGARRDEVAWLTDESVEPADSLRQRLRLPPGADGQHPLEAIARSIQDDVCLMRREGSDWLLDASVICFPTYWHLPSKVGRPIAEVHAPVDSYDPRIIDKVNRLFDRLGERPVWRRNWNLTDSRTLFHPQRRDDDPFVTSERALDELLIRSERQVLAEVADGWLAFTIRVQIASIRDLLADPPGRRPERILRLRRYLTEVPADLAARRHLSDAQRYELLAALPATSL